MIERFRVRIPEGAAGEFSSPESTLCADSYSVCVSPHVTAVARKSPGHSARSAGGKSLLNVYTLDPMKSEWADYAAVRALCGNLSGNELTRSSSTVTHSVTVILAR